MAEDDTSAAPAVDTAPAPQPSAAPSSTPSESPSTATTAVPAAADTGQPQQSKESLLDAVLKVVPATTETPIDGKPEDKPTPEGEQPKSEDQADKDAEDGSPDDDETVPQEATPAIRRRIRKLLQQRREANAELNLIRPAAQIGTELESFARTNNLSGEELASGLKAIAMYKAGDFEGFYTAIKPAIRQAQEYLGVVLPNDLAHMVQQGQMTEQTAKVFARQRFDGQRSQAELQASQQAIARQRVEYTQGQVANAVTQFELKLAASDPDYKAKAPSVRRVTQALLSERGNSISTSEEALSIIKTAYDEVNKTFKSFRPPPVATHVQPNGSGSTPSVHASPKTMYEAAVQALRATRTGG